VPLERRPEPVLVDLEAEALLAVDLDHRYHHAVSALEVVVARDIDELEVVPADRADDVERRFAEVASVGDVQTDARDALQG
jgi:hypothetical protein